MTIPNIATFDHGTCRVYLPTLGPMGYNDPCKIRVRQVFGEGPRKNGSLLVSKILAGFPEAPAADWGEEADWAEVPTALPTDDEAREAVKELTKFVGEEMVHTWIYKKKRKINKGERYWNVEYPWFIESYFFLSLTLQFDNCSQEIPDDHFLWMFFLLVNKRSFRTKIVTSVQHIFWIKLVRVACKSLGEVIILFVMNLFLAKYCWWLQSCTSWGW